MKAAGIVLAVALALALQTTLARFVFRGAVALDLGLVVVVYVALAARSLKSVGACAAAALAAGVWPQARNFIWTGDAFFPFLGRWMGRGSENAFTLAAVLADTHSEGFSLSPAQILRYPVDMVLRGDSYGVGHYFGPVLLAFAPLLIFVRRVSAANVANDYATRPTKPQVNACSTATFTTGL